MFASMMLTLLTTSLTNKAGLAVWHRMKCQKNLTCRGPWLEQHEADTVPVLLVRTWRRYSAERNDSDVARIEPKAHLQVLTDESRPHARSRELGSRTAGRRIALDNDGTSKSPIPKLSHGFVNLRFSR